MNKEIEKGIFERNKSSKTTYKADKIRIELERTHRDLGYWTPKKLSNGAIISMYNSLIPRIKPRMRERKKK